MIKIAASVKNNIFNIFSLSLLGNFKSDCFCRVNVSAVLIEVLVNGRSRNKRYAGLIVDDLSVDVLQGTVNAKTGASSSTADLAADTLMPLKSCFIGIFSANHKTIILLLLRNEEHGGLFLTLTCFTFLDSDILSGISDTLAVVRLRRLLAADLGGYLADTLLVATAYD